MVEEPTTTTSEVEDVAALVADDASPAVDVMLTEVEDGSEDDAVSVGAVLSLVEELGVGLADEGGGELVAVLGEDMVGVVEVGVADEVPPVPTICLLFGMMPSGMVSAPI